MRNFILIFCLFPFLSSHAQESEELRGEVYFPFINQYSAYGLNDTLADKILAVYERHYKKAKRRKDLNPELCLFELVKKHGLLFNPYVIITNRQGEELVIYMDSVSYQQTQVWKYSWEELSAKESCLWVEAKANWLGENAYWLSEFHQITLQEDKSRSQGGSKFARDVYRE